VFTVPGGKGGSVIISDTAFTSLKGHVNDCTLKGLEDMGFTNMTHIQAKAIPPLLEGTCYSDICVVSICSVIYLVILLFRNCII